MPPTYKIFIATVGLFAAATATANDVLPTQVASTLQRFKLPPATLSVTIKDLESGEVVLDIRGDEPRNPASTMKLVTGLASLERLGPAYRWKTRLFADGVTDDGRVDGNVVLVGGGDPYLVEERLYRWIRDLRVRGLESVSGDLVIDDSLFETPPEDRGAFDNEPFRVYNALPSAVLANFNAVRFLFSPAENALVKVLADPNLDELRVRNNLRSIDGRCRGYRRGIAASEHPDVDIVFSGRFPNRCRRYGFTRSVMPPWRYAGSLFRWVFESIGGTIDGRIVRGSVSENAELIGEFESLSLAEIVRLMNKHSSNLIARQLLLTMAVEAGASPANESAGVAEIAHWLDEADFEWPEFVMENGAGRSRVARITTQHLVELIDYGWRSRVMPEFVASMALYGADGTLAEREDFPSLRGRAHLKTGSLDHVTALAGVFHAANGRRFALAIAQNAENAHRGGGQAVQDRLLEWLSSQNPPPSAR
ncbi:MAG: D-alanyl-D-alanine carboxypeptidase/D-alanyl-D-alanine-endopeptidase [Pseudomonadota bacterium]